MSLASSASGGTTGPAAARFYAERDTRSNVVLWTALPGSEPQAATADAADDGPPAGGEAGA